MSDQQNPGFIWKIEPFGALSGKEVHDMLKLREEIFVVEQDCAYHEIDGKDPDCIHVLGTAPKGEMVATARIAPAGLIYTEVSIGRVVVNSKFRGMALGDKVMELAIDHCQKVLRARSIKIAAQAYLEKFYGKHGFKTISEPYMWDGIPHIDMLLNFQPND